MADQSTTPPVTTTAPSIELTEGKVGNDTSSVLAPTSIAPVQLTAAPPAASAVVLAKSHAIDIDSKMQIDHQNVTMAWHNIHHAVSATIVDDQGVKKNIKRALLKNISGYCQAGQVLAIMGPSGSGKSTLLDALSGRISRHKYEGKVFLNGREQSEDVFRDAVSYVPQADNLIGSLTVAETLQYAAEFTLGGEHWNGEERKKRIDTVLSALGLTSAANTKIGDVFFKGVSGGQKRRVSIGIELVHGPPVLCLDEPTSGLDSASAQAVMDVLFGLARQGHSIITTLHQPNTYIFEKIDLLCLLSGGEMCYFGPARDAQRFFETSLGQQLPSRTNAADWLLDSINVDFVKHDGVQLTVSAFNSTLLPALEHTVTTLSNPFGEEVKKSARANWLQQFWTLSKRNFFNFALNPGVYWLRIAMYGALCLCLGSMFWNIGTSESALQDRISILFFTNAFLTFMSVAAIPAFIQERAVFIRERTNAHYGPFAYVCSNTISQLPWLFLISAVSCCIQYWMIGLNDAEGKFGIYLLGLWVALFCAESLQMTISSLAPVFIIGLAISSFILGLFMLLCGFFLITPNIPRGWKWAHYALSFHTYYFGAIMKNDLDGLVFQTSYDTTGTTTITGYEILQRYDMQDVSIRDYLVVVWGMAMVYRVFFYSILKWIQTGKR